MNTNNSIKCKIVEDLKTKEANISVDNFDRADLVNSYKIKSDIVTIDDLINKLNKIKETHGNLAVASVLANDYSEDGECVVEHIEEFDLVIDERVKTIIDGEEKSTLTFRVFNY